MTPLGTRAASPSLGRGEKLFFVGAFDLGAVEKRQLRVVLRVFRHRGRDHARPVGAAPVVPGGASVPAGAHALVQRLEARAGVVLGERVEDVHQVAATLGVERFAVEGLAGRAPFVAVAAGSPRRRGSERVRPKETLLRRRKSLFLFGTFRRRRRARLFCRRLRRVLRRVVQLEPPRDPGAFAGEQTPVQLRLLRVEVTGDEDRNALPEPALQEPDRRAHAPRAVPLRGAILHPVVARLEVRAAHDHGQTAVCPPRRARRVDRGGGAIDSLELDPGERDHARAPPAVGLAVHARAEGSAVHPLELAAVLERERVRVPPHRTPLPSRAERRLARDARRDRARRVAEREIVVRLQERRGGTGGLAVARARTGRRGRRETRVPSRRRARVGVAGGGRRRTRGTRGGHLLRAEQLAAHRARVLLQAQEVRLFPLNHARHHGNADVPVPSPARLALARLLGEPARRVGVVVLQVPGHQPHRAKLRRRGRATGPTGAFAPARLRVAASSPVLFRSVFFFSPPRLRKRKRRSERGVREAPARRRDCERVQQRQRRDARGQELVGQIQQTRPRRFSRFFRRALRLLVRLLVRDPAPLTIVAFRDETPFGVGFVSTRLDVLRKRLFFENPPRRVRAADQAGETLRGEIAKRR